MTKADVQYLSRLLVEIERLLKQVYGDTYSQVIKIRAVQDAIASGQEFTWMKNPNALKQFEDMLAKLNRNVSLIMNNGCATAIGRASTSATKLINEQTKEQSKEEQQEQADKTEDDVLNAHRSNAKQKGFTTFTDNEGKSRISSKVWDFSNNAKKEMEIIIQNGIIEGKTADEIALSVKKYLNNPDALFRRVRNKETGKLELSKSAMNYHPKRGVYRSAYQNALRLARTEINASYLASEQQAYLNDKQVIGLRIQLSKNHTTKTPDGEVKQLHDMCDQLVGDYPKDFVFRGWHPNCRCIMTPIIAKPKDVRNGNVSYIQDLPSNFTEWMVNNQERLSNAPITAYFVSNNASKIANIDGVSEESKIALGLPEEVEETKLTPQEYAEQEHIDLDSIKTALMQYSTIDKRNQNTAYQMGFNDQALNLIEDIAKGDYGLATDIAKQAIEKPSYKTYGASLSEKQSYILAKTAYENKLVKGSGYNGKTIFNFDAREEAKLKAQQEANKKQAKKESYNANYKKSSTKIAVGAIVYDEKGNQAIIEQVITASTGYVLIKYADGKTKKVMAFNLFGEDGNPLKKKKF